MATSTGVVDAIAEENLGVYRASPIRLREDVSQEAQIASDYRGRLVYELLQNADDAMTGTATEDDRIVVRLTDTDLWVGNSGRLLDEADVKGLCGLGASRKEEIVGRRRASIGHKGMGFKSVLEITTAPEVFSEDYAFRMAADVAREPIEDLMAELGHRKPGRVPVMRFPSTLTTLPDYWEELHRSGIRTLFRFPLRADLTDDQRSLLAERLLALPVTTILFLKHLERVEISVETKQRHESFFWQIRRNRWTGAEWKSCIGLTETGTYQVRVEAADESHDFLLVHDADVEIGDHRGGLDTYAWEGIEVSEVSVAALLE
ncbi:MAG: sacsin N-terminal ATP-binding-like domain-containing protein, partial [Gammaproteobacteria bacterium]